MKEGKNGKAKYYVMLDCILNQKEKLDNIETIDKISIRTVDGTVTDDSG